LERITAVVTGASGDLGAAVVSRLIDAGAHVIMVGRDRERLLARSGIHHENGRCTALAADLTEIEGVAAVERAVADRGKLDVLVLGSGIYRRSHDPVDLSKQFASNVFGPYALLVSVSPYLVRAQGQVVFINSTQGLKAAPGVGQFAATQHAMRAIADTFRDEVNEAGVRVLTIYLGRTATARQRAIYDLEKRSYKPEQLIQPDDVAQLILNLANLPRTTEATEITLRPMRKG
jgi:NADP-dependent 3-hydroxy acid dehydrogenase YdfG